MGRIVVLPPAATASSEGAKPGGWWHDSDDGKRIVCDLCPRTCVLSPGQRGFCFVRENRHGRMVLTTYGRSTGFCIDPIEKKPLNHFFPGTPVLSFGTAGCNLGCKFCQNWSISKSRQVESLSESALPEAIAQAAREHDCRSVAFTYNDPIIWAEYAVDTALACRAAGINTVAVTSGYISPEARKPFFEVMDAANVDLKAFTENFYRKLTGGHLEPVCDTLRWLVHETDVWTEITTLLIPGANDSDDEIQRMCRWIVEQLRPDVPLHFSSFHPDFRMNDRPPTPPDTLRRARDLARRAGMKYVYTGNVRDPGAQSTYCPTCENLLIERSGYQIGRYAMAGNRCATCQTMIPGHFSAGHGDWGARRQPVRIASFAPPVAPEGVQENPTNRPSPKDVESSQSGVIGSRVPSEGGSGMASRVTSTIDHDRHSQKPSLDREQEELVFRAAGRRVVAAVKNLPGESMTAVLADVAEKPLLGAFVTLKRSGQLRSCCGFMGQSVPLGQAVDHAAFRAAKEDPRFPPISPTELKHLEMDVWLLWGLQPVEAKGEERAAAVTIGRHGLQVAMGNQRGLLLPGVATEHKLDPVAFLEAVCRKAGLPNDAWKSDDATLMTFEGYAIEGRLSEAVSPDENATPPGGPSPDEVAELADFARQNLLALCQGAVPSYYLPGGFDGGVHGLVVTVKAFGTDETIHCSRVNVRPEIPLQSTLLDVLKTASSALQSRRVPLATLQTVSVGLTVLWDPAMQGTLAEPALDGISPRRRALVVLDQGKWSLVYNAKQAPEQSLSKAAEAGRFLNPSQAGVFSLEVVSTESLVSVSNVPQPQKGPELRAPAVAGRFYPGSAEEISKALDDLLDEKVAKQPWAAAMVPHAGWIYSGRLAARVLRQVEIPDRVIVFAPKHNRVGADWAVAPHRAWSLPSGQVKSDPELAARLAEAVGGMELDAAAHGPEHSIEVQLPILARLAPGVRVVGVAMHGGDLASLQTAAAQLAGLLAELPKPPLLVISTDMNHYADEPTTRRADQLALDALGTLDATNLFETVRHNQISMCGIVPAVLVLDALRRLGALNRMELVGHTTSAEASGDTSRVVGYAGALFA